MTELAVTDEQANVIRRSDAPVLVRDAQGKPIGHITPLVSDDSLQNAWSIEELREAKQQAASAGPRYSTEQVLSHFAALEP